MKTADTTVETTKTVRALHANGKPNRRGKRRSTSADGYRYAAVMACINEKSAK